MMVYRRKRTCSRCYSRVPTVTFTGDNKQCDTCLDEKERGAKLRSSGTMSRHYEEMMDQKPDGCPVKYSAKRRGLDTGLLWKMVYAHRDVCQYMEKHLGACKVTTPEQVVLEALGDPDESVDKTALNRLIVTYLSASVDAATWLGWFYPYSRRKERGWQK